MPDVGNAYVQIVPSAKGIKGKITAALNDEAESAGKSAGTKISSGIGTALKATTAGLAAAAAGVAMLAKQSVAYYAQYEQLVGGVETLFGAGGLTMAEYATQEGKAVSEIADEYTNLKKVENEAITNAANAYKTAGLSANDYMSTVTSFSAALISSLDGDTEAAVAKADTAITDMSDNANKMGTSMESIQNAYQGFAKQNYTMLDNLNIMGSLVA